MEGVDVGVEPTGERRVIAVLGAGGALGAAMELARRLADGPTKAYGLLRRCIVETYDGTLSSSLHLERLNQAIVGKSADFAEGLEAFRTKRKPKYTGR